MKRYIFSLLSSLLVLVAFPVAAGGPQATCEVDQRPTAKVTAPMLFAGIDTVGLSGDRQVEVTYLVEDAETFRETLKFSLESGMSDPVVELLAYFPQVRHEFVEAEGEAWAELDDGSVIRKVSRESLLAGGEFLIQGRPLVPARGEAMGAHDFDIGGIGRIFAASTCDQTCCYNNCQAYFEQCESGCGTPPAEDCLERCDAEYYSCAEFCDGCPYVTEWTEADRILVSYTGNVVCAQDVQAPLGNKVEYDEIVAKTKYTKYRETEECDGSKTTEVLSVTYSDNYICYVLTTTPCYYGSSTAPTCVHYP